MKIHKLKEFIKQVIEESQALRFRNAELVPIWYLDLIKEYDRAGRGANPSSRKQIEDIKKWMKSGYVKAFKEPLVIMYGQVDHKVYLGEGNHRLVAAKELGFKRLPCVVNRVEGRVGKGRKVKFPYPENEDGYVPSDFKPSEIGIPTE